MNTLDVKHGLTLGVGAALAILVIVIVYQSTRETIRATSQRQLEAQLTQLLEPGSYDNLPSRDTIELTDAVLGSEKPKNIYRARINGRPTGLVISATAPDGYSGDIELLIGLSYAGSINGVRVTSHSETPGLGDDIELERSNWIRAFDQLSVANTKPIEWQVKKDGGRFDQFTGATITPRAVVHAVHRVANWYQQRRDFLFTE